LLTILVKLLTLPLTIKQYRSMAAMKKIQPEMQALKEKYQKQDPMRFQQESMALYKKHGVNPVAGCLPMLLMMPVYFALYRTIYSAVELYQASFFGWLSDLSMPDPYLITPVALGLLMLLQARLNPSPGMDPTQRKMMTTFMPLMFGGMMLFLPSGLVLYIFVNTVLGIFQQVWSQKQTEVAA
jgi:YidC/Oxa1 family membrane protein insertase